MHGCVGLEHGLVLAGTQVVWLVSRKHSQKVHPENYTWGEAELPRAKSSRLGIQKGALSGAFNFKGAETPKRENGNEGTSHLAQSPGLLAN